MKNLFGIFICLFFAACATEKFYADQEYFDLGKGRRVKNVYAKKGGHPSLEACKVGSLAAEYVRKVKGEDLVPGRIVKSIPGAYEVYLYPLGKALILLKVTPKTWKVEEDYEEKRERERARLKNLEKERKRKRKREKRRRKQRPG